MNRNIGIGLLVAWLGLTSTSWAAPSPADQLERAKGVAHFLLQHDGGIGHSRFADSMVQDPELTCLMPQTAARLEGGDLRWFVKGLSALDELLDEELGLLPAKAFMLGLVQSHGLAVEHLDQDDELLSALRLMQIDFEGRTLPLAQQASRGSTAQRDLVNGMFFAGPRVTSSLKRISETIATLGSAQICSTAKADQTDIRTAVDQIVDGARSIETTRDLLRTYSSHLHPNDEAIALYCQGHGTKALCAGGAAQRASYVEALLERRRPLLKEGRLGTRWDRAIADILRLAAHWSTTPDFYESGDNSYRAVPIIVKLPSNTQRAMQAVSLLRSSHSQTAHRIAPHLMFLAEFSDASTAEETEEVLTSYLTPRADAAAQREQPGAQLLLSSYVGIQGGWLPKGSQGQWGMFMPVGLEWSWGMPDLGVLALTLAPFDLGHPVSANLNGASENLTLAAVVAPSAMVSWGLADSPLSLGLGVQRGTTFDGTGRRETRAFVMLGWDVPLLRLY